MRARKVGALKSKTIKKTCPFPGPNHVRRVENASRANLSNERRNVLYMHGLQRARRIVDWLDRMRRANQEHADNYNNLRSKTERKAITNHKIPPNRE